MASELTRKQAQFVKHYIANGGNGTQAALNAYDTDDNPTARAIASENLTRPNVRRALQADLAAENLHPRRLAAKLNKLIDHERTLISPTGEVIGKEADPATQLKAIDITAKLLALYPDRNGEGGFKGHLHQHVHLEASDGQLLAWIAANKRLPSEAERQAILAPDPQPVVVDPPDNNCDEAK